MLPLKTSPLALALLFLPIGCATPEKANRAPAAPALATIARLGRPQVATDKQGRRIYPSAAQAVAFSPGGEIVLSAGNNRVQRWDARPGRGASGLDITSPTVISADGRMMAAATHRAGVTALFDLASGTEIRRFETEAKPWLHALALSPDLHFLASGGDDRKVRLWDVQSGKLVSTLEGHRGQIECLAFSPDGGVLASGGSNVDESGAIVRDQSLRVWDVASGKMLREVTNIGYPTMSIAFSPDGRLLASTDFDSVILRETKTLKRVRHLDTVHEGSRWVVELVAFSPDGKRVASADASGAVVLWDVGSGTMIARSDDIAPSVSSLAFSPDGRTLATGLEDGTVVLFDTGAG